MITVKQTLRHVQLPVMAPRIVKIVCFALICSLLSGCPIGLLMRVGGRAGIPSGLVLRTVGSLGGEVLAVRTIAQSNIGAAVAADANLMRLATRPLAIELRTLNSVERGRVLVNNREVNVVLENSRIRVVRDGQIARQYDISSGKQVSYTRYSMDQRRLDYSVWNPEAQRFEYILYGIRHPQTGSVAFFGRNHAYLGRAVYGDTVGRGASAAAIAALAAGTPLFIEFQDFVTVPQSESCSDELVLVRRTYFNQGEIPDSPDEFWDAMYKDCPMHDEVRRNYAQFRLEQIMLMKNIVQKREALVRYLQVFPDSLEGSNLLKMIDGELRRGT